MLRNCNEKDHYPANRMANKLLASDFCDSNRNKLSNANHRFQNDCDNGQLLRRQYQAHHPVLSNILKDEQAMKFRGLLCLLTKYIYINLNRECLFDFSLQIDHFRMPSHHSNNINGPCKTITSLQVLDVEFS